MSNIVRHHGVNRLFHWLSAVALLVLLFTGIAPGLGVDFAWVTIHWIAGLALTILVLWHIVRASVFQAQKSMHATVTVLSLVAIVTGLVMMVKIDTPFWERDPYWLDAAIWGIVYVLHGLSSMLFVTVVMVHVYFALRPEKLFYTRSMIRGWITREELQENHDPAKWPDADPS